MTVQQALQLSIAHNLGSARNTLMPGVAVPAYQGGDPNDWAAKVQAIGLSRLAPVGSDVSQFTTAQDAVAPMWTGGNNTQVVRKDPQAQATAIARLVSVLKPAMAASGSFSTGTGGNWVFGDSIGGASQALTNAQTSNRNYDLALRQQALARQQQAINAAAMERRQNLDEVLASQQVTNNNRLLATGQQDRVTYQQQQDFENSLRLAQMAQQQGDASQLSKIGLEGLREQQEGIKTLGTAIADYNAEAERLASQHNQTNPESIMLSIGQDGLARLSPGKGAGTLANEAIAGLNASQQARRILEAQQAIQNASLKLQSTKFLRPTTVALPKAPNLLNQLQPPVSLSPSAAAAARSGARPLLVPGFARPVTSRASVAPAAASVPAAGGDEVLDAMMGMAFPEFTDGPVLMQNPSGSVVRVPPDRIGDAVNAGYSFVNQ